jgi:hypothetical protein
MSNSANWGDVDNDGDLDLIVANYRENPNSLYINQGKEYFILETSGPVDDVIAGSVSASWVDYNLDGYLDLFLSNSSGDIGQPYAPYRNFLYRNDSGTLTEITTGEIVTQERHSYRTSWSNYDDDRLPDLVITNASGQFADLYHNDGEGEFTRASAGIVYQLVQCGGGTSWGNYDNDGDMDIYIGASPGPGFLFRNNGDGTFSEAVNHGLGIYDGSSFAGLWGDYDNDGDLDMYLWLRHSQYPDSAQGFLFENLSDGTFGKLTTGAIAEDTCTATAAVWGDYDRDGDLDLYLANYDPYNQGNPVYLRNDLFRNNGNSNNWIIIKPIGSISNRSSFGVMVRLRASIEGSVVWQLRELAGQTVSSAQPPLELHFGLGDASIVDSIILKWPSGIIDTLTDVQVNQYTIITEADYSDLDGDGILGIDDNYPLDYNPDQIDGDGDGVGDACDQFNNCGDANGDEAINVGDAVFIINYVFKGGPAPDPQCVGNANGDGEANVGDAVYLINYIFKGGSAPVEPCCP